MVSLVRISFDVLVFWVILTKPVTSSVFIRKELMPCDPEIKVTPKPNSGNLTSCSQRLFLSLKLVQDEELKKKYQFVVVDSAYDISTKQEIRLLRPLVLRIIQHPATIAYPFKYLFAANNKPYEITLNKKAVSNYTGCDPSSIYQPACQKNEHLAPNRGQNGRVITQGFCCPCETNSNDNKRDNLVCDGNGRTEEGIDPQATTHCLRFDPVWYSVNELKPPVFHHKVGITIYVEDKGKKGNRIWKLLWPKDPNIVLGTHHPRVTQKKIVASYIEMTQPTNGMTYPLDHEKQYVLIPQPHISGDDYVPPQTMQGPEEFLMVNKSMVDQSGTTCNKIGVSYDAFDKQLKRCHSPINSCLQNSIQDMWLHDTERTVNGGKTDYFLSSYGRLSEPSVVQEPTTDPLLLFDMELKHVSHVYIDINADLIQTTVDVHGEIFRGVSLSDDTTTEIEVHVHNHGLVTAIFTTRIVNCSSAVTVSEKHKEAINPYSSATFLFKLNHATTPMPTQIQTCTAELLDRSGRRVAHREVTFQSQHRCFCIAECSCKCTSQRDWNKCEPMSKKDDLDAGISTPLVSTTADRLKTIRRSLFIFLIILLLLLLLGILKCIGAFCHHMLVSDSHVTQQEDGLFWREYGLKSICSDIFFFYHWPCSVTYQYLVKKCSKAEKTAHEETEPKQRISEVFVTLKEDTGSYAVSDSEGEEMATSSQKQPESDRQSASTNDDWKWSNRNNSRRGDNNENNSRRVIPSEESGTDGKSQNSIESVVPVTSSETGRELSKVSSSTSLLSKKAIELKFRKQKARLKGNLTEASETETAGLPGSLTVVASETSNETIGKKFAAEVIPQSDRDDDPVSEIDLQVLNVLSAPGRLVYFNQIGKTVLLHKSGDSFSLCGILKKSGLYYKFTLGINTTQLFWNKKGKTKKLTTPLPISAKNFVKVMTSSQAIQDITLEPRHPCLNYVK